MSSPPFDLHQLIIDRRVTSADDVNQVETNRGTQALTRSTAALSPSHPPHARIITRFLYAMAIPSLSDFWPNRKNQKMQTVYVSGALPAFPYTADQSCSGNAVVSSLPTKMRNSAFGLGFAAMAAGSASNAKTGAKASPTSPVPVQTNANGNGNGPSKKKKPYPFWLGGVAATIAASVTHPLDLTKVRLQASGDKRMIESVRKTVRTAGVLGLYDGITGTWLRQMSYSMCRFWAYDMAKGWLGVDQAGKLIRADGEIGEQAGIGRLAAAGSIAGGIAGLVGNPGEIVMVRLQGDFAKPPEKRFNYKNSIHAVYKMVSDEGMSSLARGVAPNVLRAVLMNASQLASYDWFKAQLLTTKYFDDNIMCHFTASFAAGTVATTVCSPADVLKSRIMNASGPGSSSTLAVIKTSLKNEGPLFIFKGWVPAWMRLQPTTILIFLTLEQLKNGVDVARTKGILTDWL